MDVYFEEHEDSPIERGNRDGEFQFTRIFLTSWADRWLFLREMFQGGPFGGALPYSSEYPNLVCDTFNVERLANNPVAATITNPATQLLTHNAVAKITIEYKQYEQNNITYEQQEQGEFVTVPSRGLLWASDNVPLPADISAAYPTTTTRHVITWSQITSVPWQTLSECINKVNSVPFRIPITGQLLNAGTLLFAEKSASITMDFRGLTTWKLVLTFLEKAQTAWSVTGGAAIGGSTVYGWNWQWRDSIGDFDRPKSAVGGGFTFQETDLLRIFN